MYWKTFDFKSQKVGRIGEVLNKLVYRCGFCKGTGFMPSRKGIKCPVCSGEKTVNVRPPAVVCAYCNGEGRSLQGRDLSCIVCRGKGVVSVESKVIEICPTCKGRGRERAINLSCMTCKGKGVVIKK